MKTGTRKEEMSDDDGSYSDEDMSSSSSSSGTSDSHSSTSGVEEEENGKEARIERKRGHQQGKQRQKGNEKLHKRRRMSSGSSEEEDEEEEEEDLENGMTRLLSPKRNWKPLRADKQDFFESVLRGAIPIVMSMEEAKNASQEKRELLLRFLTGCCDLVTGELSDMLAPPSTSGSNINLLESRVRSCIRLNRSKEKQINDLKKELSAKSGKLEEMNHALEVKQRELHKKQKELQAQRAHVSEHYPDLVSNHDDFCDDECLVPRHLNRILPPPPK